MNTRRHWLILCAIVVLIGGVQWAGEIREPTASPHKKSRARTPAASVTPVPDSATPQAAPKSDETTASKTRDDVSPEKPEHAPAATLDPSDLAEFAAQPPRVQALIASALELTKLNLTYTYGSADPARGGMDCSGTIFYVLNLQGFKDVPRDSSGQYEWARRAGPFFAVVSRRADSFEFADLKPGDLMFWTGTYGVARDIPITHVMLYLGTEKKSKKRVMFGASDGRSYNGIQRWGVSVFDFKMPKTETESPVREKATFVGYSRIPTLRDAVTSVPEPVRPSTPAESLPKESAKTEKQSGSGSKSGDSKKGKTSR
ncbi:MAG TPA: NlpC/P60 family protein [Chthoniobacteraceae bacterium]|nr:NlpC/P60 family protein [Chthoniobacteraceae bacterium]